MDDEYFDPTKQCPVNSDPRFHHRNIGSQIRLCPLCKKTNAFFQQSDLALPATRVSKSTLNNTTASSTVQNSHYKRRAQTFIDLRSSSPPTANDDEEQGTVSEEDNKISRGASSLSKNSDSYKNSSATSASGLSQPRAKTREATVVPQVFGMGQRGLSNSILREPRRTKSEYPLDQIHNIDIKVYFLKWQLSRETGLGSWFKAPFTQPLTIPNVEWDPHELFQDIAMRVMNALMRKTDQAWLQLPIGSASEKQPLVFGQGWLPLVKGPSSVSSRHSLEMPDFSVEKAKASSLLPLMGFEKASGGGKGSKQRWQIYFVWEDPEAIQYETEELEEGDYDAEDVSIERRTPKKEKNKRKQYILTEAISESPSPVKPRSKKQRSTSGTASLRMRKTERLIKLEPVVKEEKIDSDDRVKGSRVKGVGRKAVESKVDLSTSQGASSSLRRGRSRGITEVVPNADAVSDGDDLPSLQDMCLRGSKYRATVDNLHEDIDENVVNDNAAEGENTELDNFDDAGIFD